MKTYKHWAIFPSADPFRGAECAKLWEAAGYTAFIGLENGRPTTYYGPAADFRRHVLPEVWQGYYGCIGWMVKSAFDHGADVCTMLGDDMRPAMHGAQFHAELYFKRFPDGNGVMQCTGDRQGIDASGLAASERICGSPTFAKAWMDNHFKGNGGFPPGFKNYYCDEALKLYAEKRGLLYQEPMLLIDHLHWSFSRMERQDYHKRNQQTWQDDKATFEKWKAAGFPEKLE